jgi:hypothetical protein
MMAVMIFSGNAFNWNDFGNAYPSKAIEACLRHAGSGTHATLDYAVMRGIDWGWALPTVQSLPPNQPIFYFNDGSTDMMKCVNGEGVPPHAPNFPTGTNTLGRIGYADADQGNRTFTYGPVKYNGFAPLRGPIRNGQYDFWSAQWCYDDCTGVNGCPVVEASLYAWADRNVPTAKADYWTPICEMTYNKATDQDYPNYVGASCPRDPNYP